jgi:hypothetical protein
MIKRKLDLVEEGSLYYLLVMPIIYNVIDSQLVSKVRAKYIEADKVLAEQGSGDSNKANNVNYDHLLFDKKITLAIEGYVSSPRSNWQ